MSKDISVQHTTPDFTGATTSARVIGTTLGAGLVVVGAIIISPGIFMFALNVFGATETMRDNAERAISYAFLLVPLCSAGAYWMALFMLRHVNMLLAWLTTLGFCLLYWFVMPRCASTVLQTTLVREDQRFCHTVSAMPCRRSFR